MSQDRPSAASLFTQVDISPSTELPSGAGYDFGQGPVLQAILSALDRQNELLEELVSQVSTAVAQVGASQRQRAQELGQWREANPGLARNCRLAAEALGRVQTEFLNTLTEEVTENAEAMADGEFVLTEFVDRFGPRLAHLNGVLQVLAQLGTVQIAQSNQGS
jgi:hypothetical protein